MRREGLMDSLLTGLMWGVGTALGGVVAWLVWRAITGQAALPTTPEPETQLTKTVPK